ncbi:MAG TPA: DUF4013 domain-containing protein [Phycisphaerales bacterium]|nr:DUF4013 domain-containing protein [Phycisphaerales bacterium]
MFKKAVYPFTDWNWLKLPLASAAVGGFFFVFWLGTISGMVYHRNDSDTAGSLFGLAGMITMLVLFILATMSVGWLLRVAVQPSKEEPLKLPSWSNPLVLIKDGFLALVGGFLESYTLLLLMYAGLAAFGLTTALPGLAFSHLEWKALSNAALTVAGITTIIGYLCMLAVFYTWVTVFAPLLMVRYAHTRKFRHLLNPLWVWRAFTIAPTEFILRSLAWPIALVVVTVLTPLTAGVANAIGVILLPLSLVNTFYLLGDYYRIYLDD